MKAQHGYLLISVVVTLMILSAVTLMMNEESVMESRRLHDETETLQLRYLAEAGMEHAEWQLQQQGCGPYSDLPTQNLGSGSYSATITPNNAGGMITTYRVPVSDDAYIDKNNASQNYGNVAQLEAYWTFFPSADKRALYRFDIAATGIPAGASISSAVFKVFVIDPHNSATVKAYRITSDWTETNVNWDNINASYDSSEVASIPSGTPAGAYYSLNITALAQGWINGSIANQGIMLRIPFSLSTDLAQYASKEYGNLDQRPYLEIKVSSGISNRADIQTTATLANGLARSLTRSNIPLYQASPNTTTLQPDASGLKDAWIEDSKQDPNNGTSNILLVNSNLRSLMEFNLGSIPFQARIAKATLELYNETSATGTVSLHRLTSAWEEGSCDGNPCNPDGVTWNTRDGVNAWPTPGGDFESAAVDTAEVAANAWNRWDVTRLVRGWISGEFENRGFLLQSANAGNINFTSSDSPTASQHPKLTITYACQCGIVCQAPQGSGKIALVANLTSGNLEAADLKKKGLMESWGYSVTPYDDENLSALDPSRYDLVYVSETSVSSKINNQLTGIGIPVVNEEPKLYDNLEMASSWSGTVGTNLTISDNSHYITALFPQGDLPMYNADMGLLTVGGSLAPDLQTLADIGGIGSLVVIDRGGQTTSGGTAAGPRILLPMGNGSSGNLNWDYLNNNGRLLIQRALQWAADYAPPAPPPKKIYWTDDQAEVIQRSNEDGSNIETVVANQPKVRGLDIDTVNGKIYWTAGSEIRRADLDGSNIETLISNIFVTHFDIKLDVAAGKMYWSHDNLNNNLMRANLDGSGAEVINSSVQQPTYLSLDRDNGQLYANSFLLGDVMRMEVDGSGLTTLVDGTDTGIVGSALDLAGGRMFWSGGSSNDWIRSAALDGSNVQTLVTGLNAPQDIAYDADNDRIYWADALVDPAIKRANADGSNVETIVTGLTRPRGILIVNADQVPAVQPFICNGNYLDHFETASYANSDGSLAWKSDWTEINESDGPGSGDEQIRTDIGHSSLRVRDNDGGGEGVERAFDLSGASSAILRLLYRRNKLDNSDDKVTLYLSSNGSAGPWNELVSFAGDGTDSDYVAYSADISSFIGSDMRIRLLSSSSLGGLDEVYFDDIEILCSP